MKKLILIEVKRIPKENLPQVVKILHSLEGRSLAVKTQKSADEIINDIYSYRTGFDGRNIEL